MVEFRGAAAQLLAAEDEVCLIEGGAGTGKSLAACWAFHLVATRHPVRVLLARKTRESLTNSIMVTYENAVLSTYSAGRSMTSTAGRSNRSHYHYPTRAEVALAGFDKPSKILSSEYDIIVIEQAEEVLVTDVEIALTRMRNDSKYEPKRMILVANPGSPASWLMRWAEDGRLRHFKSTIKDNPLYWDAAQSVLTPDGERYMARTSRLRGVNYRRLVLGEWCAEEGAILPYDPSVHLIDGTLSKSGNYWMLAMPDRGTVALEWFACGVDWGDSSPGTIVVLGFDRDSRAYVVEQHYRTGVTTEDWAETAARIDKKYSPVVFVCDSAEKDRIALFNRRLGRNYGRDTGAVAVKANKSVLTGISEMQEWMSNGQFFILKNSLAHPFDPNIPEGRPRNLQEELPAWSWLVDATTGLTLDRPDPRRADHAIDAVRYVFMWTQDRKYRNAGASDVQRFIRAIDSLEQNVA